MMIFDMDGTLVDTRDAVRMAYHDVGVAMPGSAWGKPWTQWLPDVCGSVQRATELHAAKEKRYADRLHAVRVTALGALAARVSNFVLLTGASLPAVQLILTKVLLIDPDGVIVHACMTQTEKLGKLGQYAKREATGVYFEDDEPTAIGARVLLETLGVTGWSVCHVA